jgi:biopolymer transport protein ExbB
MKIRHVTTAFALLVPASNSIAQGFGSIFFVIMETSPDGSSRIEWVGSCMIWLLITMSMANIYLISTLWVRNKRQRMLPLAFANEMDKLLDEGHHVEVFELAAAESSDYSAILSAALRQAPSGHASMVRAAEQAGEEAAVKRFRKLEPLNVLGQVSPMIGLLGTVYGVIMAFQTIARTGGNADPVTLAAGIGTALVATFWGLLIAIPALGAYATMRNAVDAATLESVRRVDTSLNRFAPGQSRSISPAAFRASPTAEVVR